MACPARGPKQDRKILRRCTSRSPYKPQVSSEDKVAVLWKTPTAHKPRYVKGLVPSRWALFSSSVPQRDPGITGGYPNVRMNLKVQLKGKAKRVMNPLQDPAPPPPRPSPLASLPPELLILIFRFVVDENSGGTLPKSSWDRVVPLTHVCKLWRDVATNAPMLWRRIRLDTCQPELHMPPPMLEESLKRSGQVNLKLWFRYGPELIDPAPLISELHRVESFACRYEHSHEPDVISELGVADFPRLRHLLIEDQSFGSAILVPLVDATAPLESLESIAALNIPQPFVSPFFRPHLRFLSLTMEHFSSFIPSALEILVMLQGLPSLEELCIQHGESEVIEPDTYLPDVTLPRLRVLNLRENTDTLTALLSHLKFPVAALFNYRLICSDKAHTSLDGEGLDLFRTVINLFQNRTLLGRIPSFIDLHVNLHDLPAADIVLLPDRRIDGYPRSARPTFVYDADLPTGSTDQILTFICNAVPRFFSSVRSLSVNANLTDGAVTKNVPDWFSVLRDIEYLELANTPGIWLALASLHLHLAATSTTPLRDALPFPELHTLKIAQASFRPSMTNFQVPDPDVDFVFLLRSMLKIRLQAGRGVFVLIVSGARNCTAADVRMLEQFVGRVEWDGKVLVKKGEEGVLRRVMGMRKGGDESEGEGEGEDADEGDGESEGADAGGAADADEPEEENGDVEMIDG
ncbi:hypothetical protein BXZ70DRAFT_1065302 [Cristinia sonorae]|uniref:F-box domain-containing protein n=1 Tax=Cristinia sonorae TaxID=1940300 RepID=A0A8K0ULY4_9AGAR|nr:hypothetical protein BXZ70DRAFT_1065302 [Cristinia sonorae]